MAEEVVYGSYIIEITVGKSVLGEKGTLNGVIRWWKRQGSKPGSMDELLYMCTNCQTLVNHDLLEASVFCPSCATSLHDSYADGQYFTESPRSVAEKIAHYFRGLKNDADIKLVRDKHGSMKSIELDNTLRVSEREKKMDMVRGSQEVVYYVKSRLEKDLLTGTDLVNRIEAFLRS